MTIQVPSENIGRTLFRSVVEQAVQLMPFTGSVLTSIFKVTHPSTFERDLDYWRTDLTDSVNGHEARLMALERRHCPTLTLSPLALEVATWLIRNDNDAQPIHRTLQDIGVAFLSAKPGPLEEAISELEELALLNASRLPGPEGYTVRATWPLYWLMSPLLLGTTPVLDALALAHMGLDEQETSLSAFQLQNSLGWDPRRINSAMAMIRALLPDVSISQAANPSYVITGIYIDARARLGLRRFVDSARRAGIDG